MSLQFKKFEVKTPSGEIIFFAYVADKEAFRIVQDATGGFEKIFVSLIKGEFSYSLYNEETRSIEEYTINTGDALRNISEYIEILPTFSHTQASLDDAAIYHQYSLHFHGADYNMHKGMEPKSQEKVMLFFYAIHTIMHYSLTLAANNPHYKPQNFSTAEAASIKLDMYSTVDMTIFKEAFVYVLEDLECGSARQLETLSENIQKVYKKLLQKFSELSKFHNLDLLKVTLNGRVYTIDDFKNIAELSQGIMQRPLSTTCVIQSVKDNYRDDMYDALVADTKSFSHETTWKYEKNEALSKFLYFKKGEVVKLSGMKVSEHIRFLDSVEFLREDFDMTDHEVERLQEGRINVSTSRKKITLSTAHQQA